MAITKENHNSFDNYNCPVWKQTKIRTSALSKLFFFTGILAFALFHRKTGFCSLSQEYRLLLSLDGREKIHGTYINMCQDYKAESNFNFVCFWFSSFFHSYRRRFCCFNIRAAGCFVLNVFSNENMVGRVYFFFNIVHTHNIVNSAVCYRAD